MSMNAHHCWGVITSNKEKLNKIFTEIEKEYEEHIIRKITGNSRYCIKFDDGNDLIWVEPSNIRGYRFHRLWIDKDIDQQSLNEKLAPSFLYCKNEDIIWI